MNLQQFRFLREAARHKFSLTEAARALHTSQPGISKAIIDLEEELGVPILARHGKRVKGLTAPGQQVLEAAERIMRDVDNLKKLARDYAGSPEGTLRVATTHTQARYVLPGVVQAFALKFPQVRLKLLQANPPQIASMLVHGQADLGVATESLADFPGLLSIPVYDWQHVAIVKPDHPLAKFATTPGKLTLKDLGRHPLITYEHQFAGRVEDRRRRSPRSRSSRRSCWRRSTPTSSRPTCRSEWASASSPAWQPTRSATGSSCCRAATCSAATSRGSR